MADEVKITAPATATVESAPPVAPVAAPAPSPEVSAPAAQPAPVAAIAPVPEAAPAEAPIAKDLLAAEPKAAEIPKAEEKPAEPAKTEEKTAEKPVEGEKKPEAKTEDKKPDESKAEEKPAEIVPVTYEPFKLPDAYKDNTDAVETVTKFSGILGKFENSPKTHEDFQKFGQEATDFYINGVNGALSKQQDYYVNLHQKNITDRLDAVRKDPQLGGKNFDKTAADMVEVVQAYAGNKEQVVAFRKFAQETGVSVAPELVRLIANMKATIDKYTKEPVSSNIPGTKPNVEKRGTIQTLYGS